MWVAGVTLCRRCITKAFFTETVLNVAHLADGRSDNLIPFTREEKKEKAAVF